MFVLVIIKTADLASVLNGVITLQLIFFFCPFTCIDLEKGSKARVNQNKRENTLLKYFKVKVCVNM